MEIGGVAFGICFSLAMGRTASADAGLNNFGHLAGEQRTCVRFTVSADEHGIPAAGMLMLNKRVTVVTGAAKDIGHEVAELPAISRAGWA
jgi:hypothetical protein